MRKQKKIFRPSHGEPGGFWLNYILLPYGEYYKKTKDFLSAKKGDILRIYKGGDYLIDNVFLLEDIRIIDILSRMRYGVSYKAVLEKWIRYARMEGNGRDIFSTDKCILVLFGTEFASEAK